MRDERPKLLVVGIDGPTKETLARSLGDRFELIETEPGEIDPSTATPQLVLGTTRSLPFIAGSLAAELESGRAITLLNAIMLAGLEFIKIENLYTFDGQPGYSLGQGE